MKSKSFDLKRTSGYTGHSKKPFDFISLYKSVAETNNITVNQKTGDRLDKENSFTKSKNESKRENSPNKKKKKKLHEPLDISQINIEGSDLNSLNRNASLNESKVTSTPHASNSDKNRVKSIMKNSSNISDYTMEESTVLPNNKSMKRNKSVSFMLDDNEEIVKKKTRSEDSLIDKQSEMPKLQKRSLCKFKKNKKVKKLEVQKATAGDSRSSELVAESSSNNKDSSSDVAISNHAPNQEKKKKIKKQNKHEKVDQVPSDTNNIDVIENKKRNKKKHKVKLSQSTEAIDDEEPATKSRKMDVKPEVIAQNLENLSIGDNPYTLTNLLDEMTVAEKNKKNKNKRKQKKNKGLTSMSSTENGYSENASKEKAKWRRKWNKDKKGEVNNDTMTSVIVENLPVTLMCMYKTVLADHFSKCGLIKRVGVAEMYPGDSNMTFTTTINFYSDGAATQALEEDGVEIGGSRIRVKRPLSPTQTTLVVRSYAALSDQVISTTFSAVGRIRSIRHLIKGKKSVGDTVFIEFDGPEAVQRAIELASGAKVAGKKIHVAKFEIRKKKSQPKPTAETGNEGDSDDEGDSDKAND